MIVGSDVPDCAGAASMRRNTSGSPAADPADNNGRAAGIIGMPVSCGEAGDPLPADGNVWPTELAAATLRASTGAAAIPCETGLAAGTTLAVS